MEGNKIGGKLKLKNGKIDKTFIKMKNIFTKDIKDIKHTTTGYINKGEEEYLKNLENQIKNKDEKIFGYIDPDNDPRTEAEKRYDERRLKKLPEKVRKNLDINFKKKYESYYKNLSRLPQHFDIPKVGPG